MDPITGIERLTALAFIITGLSHIAAPRAWARFFIDMRDAGRGRRASSTPIVHIPLGLLIVAFHPVWSGPGLLVTLIGCALTLKGTLYFLWPALALRSMAHVIEEKAWRFPGRRRRRRSALGLFIGWMGCSAA